MDNMNMELKKVVICEDYYEDLAKISLFWQSHGKDVPIDELINDGIEMFISSFEKNNKRFFKRCSKKYQHTKHFNNLRKICSEISLEISKQG